MIRLNQARIVESVSMKDIIACDTEKGWYRCDRWLLWKSDIHTNMFILMGEKINSTSIMTAEDLERRFVQKSAIWTPVVVDLEIKTTPTHRGIITNPRKQIVQQKSNDEILFTQSGGKMIRTSTGQIILEPKDVLEPKFNSNIKDFYEAKELCQKLKIPFLIWNNNLHFIEVEEEWESMIGRIKQEK